MAGRRRCRRLRDGHGRRAAHAPLPRTARRGGRRAREPEPRPRRARPGARLRRRTLPPRHGRVGRTEWAGTVDPRGHELLVSFDLEDGVPRWRWQIGGILVERELAMAHGSPDGRRRPPAARGRPAGAARADAALHLAQRARRAARERRAGRSSRPTTASSSSGPTASRAPAGRPGGAWYRDVRAREEAARGLDDREDLWAAGTFAADARAGRMPRGDRGRRAVRRRSFRRRPRSSRRRGAARPGSSRARATRRTHSSCSPPTSSRSRPPAARPRSPAIRGSASGRAT